VDFFLTEILYFSSFLKRNPHYPQNPLFSCLNRGLFRPCEFRHFGYLFLPFNRAKITLFLEFKAG